MKIFVIESLILIVLFTIAIVGQCKDPLNVIYDMPKPIVDRCLELGLISERQTFSSKETKIKKLTAALAICAALAVLLVYVNHAQTFKDGFLISYGLWLVIDWYDFFVLDWLWICHDRRFIVPGTEDLIDSYRDYKFHFMGSVKGMIIGLPVCLIVGLIVMVL